MGISSAQRLHCLEIVQKIAYSQSPEAYSSNVEELKRTKIQSVVEYYDVNWEPIKEQWVSCYKDTNFNLGETTNNRLESTFNKVKSVCTKYSSLLQFFHEFFAVLGTLRNERNHQYVMALARKPISHSSMNSDHLCYVELVTPYAYAFIKKQIDLALKVEFKIEQSSDDEYNIMSNASSTYSVTSTSCDCNYMKRMGLPCRHVLKLRSFLSEPLFQASMVNKRWTMEYYLALSDSRFKNDKEDVDASITTVDEQPDKKTLSQAQKFRKMMTVCQMIASVGSEGGMKIFERRYGQLEHLLQHWQLGNNFEIVSEVDEEYLDKKPAVLKVDPVIPELAGELEETRFNSRAASSEDDEERPPNDKINEASQSQIDVDRSSSDEEFSIFENVKMPPKILKRGRPKGAECTVIGLPARKKQKNKFLPFCKLKPSEKDRFLLECFTSRLSANEAMSGKKLINKREINAFTDIPDTVREKDCVDMYIIEKYFENNAWHAVLSAMERKERCKWVCLACEKVIPKKDDSIMCDRCLKWSHLLCTSHKKMPKSKHWFCTQCLTKY